MEKASDVRIELVPAAGGEPVVLKPSTPLMAGEVIDSSFMSVSKLKTFLAAEVADARANGVMLSAHLKATMMKISDPIMFGHIVRVYYADVFEKHGALLEKAGFNPNNGIGHLYDSMGKLSDAEKATIEATIADIYKVRPAPPPPLASPERKTRRGCPRRICCCAASGRAARLARALTPLPPPPLLHGLRRAPASPWSTRTAASPTCTCPLT